MALIFKKDKKPTEMRITLEKAINEFGAINHFRGLSLSNKHLYTIAKIRE
jgi:hypothetical protein